MRMIRTLSGTQTTPPRPSASSSLQQFSVRESKTTRGLKQGREGRKTRKIKTESKERRRGKGSKGDKKNKDGK